MSSKEDNVSELSRKLDESQIDTSLKLLSLRNQYIPEFYDLHLNINHLKPNFNGTVTIDIKKTKIIMGRPMSLDLRYMPINLLSLKLF